jgi:hypothetical protein
LAADAESFGLSLSTSIGSGAALAGSLSARHSSTKVTIFENVSALASPTATTSSKAVRCSVIEALSEAICLKKR